MNAVSSATLADHCRCVFILHSTRANGRCSDARQIFGPSAACDLYCPPRGRTTRRKSYWGGRSIMAFLLEDQGDANNILSGILSGIPEFRRLKFENHPRFFDSNLAVDLLTKMQG